MVFLLVVENIVEKYSQNRMKAIILQKTVKLTT
jgi:hypothetical protein